VTATAPTTDCLRDAIELELALACGRLTEARLLQCRKDSTGNRARVAECRGWIDAVLDTYLDAGCPRDGAGPPAAARAPVLDRPPRRDLMR
jgi:hypothetical protein